MGKTRASVTISLLAGVMAALVVPSASAELEEIIVTARKRAENLQDLPMSVTAINADSIERLGIRNLEGVTKFTPGVNLDSGFGLNDQRLVIRGLSPSRGRPNSAILVDGIDLTTESVGTAGGSMLFNSRLLDIERVEVVKGPQSALYGRAAFTGAIQYVTRDPGDELEMDGSIDMGEYGKRYLSAGIGGPVVGDFGLRLNAMTWNEDGYYTEGFTGAPLGGGEGYGLSLTGLWQISDTVSTRARVAYSSDEFDQQATFFDEVNTLIDPPDNAVGVGNIGPNTVVGLFSGTPKGANGRQAYLTANPITGKAYEGGEQDVLNTSLKIDWDVASGVVTSYTGYATADARQVLDGDFDVRPDDTGTLDIARGGTEIDFSTETRMFSQELRYSSAFDGPFQFTVGALYWDEKVDQDERGVSALSFPFGPAGAPEGYFNDVAANTPRLPTYVTRETNSKSLYGLIEWDFVEDWRFTAEARYAREEMNVTGPGCDRVASNPQGNLRCGRNTSSDLSFDYRQGARLYTSDSVTDDYIAPKVILEWTPMDNLMTYASVSKGVKPGGISTIAAGSWLDMPPADGNLDERKFGAENLIAYELGAKSTWLDRRLILNGAMFIQDYSDKQVPVQTTSDQFVVTRIENAGSAEVFGIELEAIWQTSENTRVQAGYAYLNGEYSKLEYKTDSGNSIARAGNCERVPLTDTTDQCIVSLSGNTLEDVPEHSLVAVAGYYPPFGRGGLSGILEADVLHQSNRYADEFNDRELDAHTVFNFRLGLQGDRWDAMFYLNNVFDDDTIKVWSSGTGLVATSERTNPLLFAFPSDGFSFGPPPRHWGIRGSFRY